MDDSDSAGLPRHGPPDHTEEAELEVHGHAPDLLPETPEVLPERGPLRTVLHWIGLGEQIAGVFFVVAIFVLVLLQVAQRYLPGGGWVWTGEFARFSLVWLTFILSGFLMASDKHIALHVIDYAVPPRGLRVVKVVAHLTVALICVAMLVEGWGLVTDRSGQVTPAARMPLTWVYVIPVIGIALTLLRALIAPFVLKAPTGGVADDTASDAPMPGRLGGSPR